MPKQKIPMLALFLAFFLFLLDLITKYYTSHYLPPLSPSHLEFPYGGVAIFSNFLGIDFSIVHATNRGAAWGLFSQYQGLLLIGRIFLITCVLAYALFFNKNRMYDIPLALIITGALANVCDYFIYGHVIDMFYFTFWGYHYGIFNIADSAICIGVLLFLVIPKQNDKVHEHVS